MNIYKGYITSNGGNNPRPSSQIVYSIAVDYGGTIGVVNYSNITPNGQRPDPAVVDAIPRPVGYPFLVTCEVPGTAATVHFEETPAYAPCAAGNFTRANSLTGGGP